MNVKQGDLAEVVQSIDGHSVGMIVQVTQFMGEHSQYGPIWRCRSNDDIVTEYGAVGKTADFADDWLRPLKPKQKDKTITKLLEHHE